MPGYKTKFKPTNPEKYIGDPNSIISRSSWERDLMHHLDKNPNVLEWCSEEIVVPYVHPVDGKLHRYFPDFFVKMRTKDGTIQNAIIEVKPQKETIPPKKSSTSKRPSKRYAQEATKYLINEAKWKAAQTYCETIDATFKVMTEYDIYGPSGKKYPTRRLNNKKTKSKKKNASK